MARIEKVQYHASLAMTGCWRGTSQNKLYDELGIESLADRRWARRLIYFFKIDNNLTPNYLKENLVPLCSRSLRNDNINGYREIMCSTSRYKNSFFPDSIRSWNNVGIDFIPSNSINIFKNNVFCLARPKPRSFFNVHDPIGLKFLFQLRVGLSPLKAHKKHHNFIDTPNDWCDCHCSPEDTFHFFFSCALYAAARENMLSTVSNILILDELHDLVDNVELYLYGNPSLSSADNKIMLLSTIKFIKDTKTLFMHLRAPPPPPSRLI